MKFALLVAIFCVTFTLAQAEEALKETKSACRTSIGEKAVAASGCCSWHDGVCSCSGGDVICCDGTESPSCNCSRENSRIISFEEKRNSK